jgi:NAD(P)H-flavin reductase
MKMGAPIREQLTLPGAGDMSDLLVVAGGTGLAPLLAVLGQIDRCWEATGSPPRVHLFHGSRMAWNSLRPCVRGHEKVPSGGQV